MRFGLPIGAMIFAAASGWVALAQPIAVEGPIPATYFGMTFIDRRHIVDADIGAIGKGTLVAWPYIARHPDDFDWRNLDQWVEAASAKRLDFVYSFKGVPEWAASDGRACESSAVAGVKVCKSFPKDIGTFDKFVASLVARYKGRIQYYELWNEPEYDSQISIPQMVELTNHAHDIIRRIDPDAKIISPSLNGRYPDYADRYFASGGNLDVDIVSLHTYPAKKANFPESLDWTYDGARAVVSPLRPVLLKYGLSKKPIWSTEGAWSDRPEAILDAYDRAGFVSRALLLHWSFGFSRYYWYAYDHLTIGRLMNTEAGRAYAVTKSWMTGSRMTGRCQADSLEIWRCELRTSAEKRILVVWSLRGKQTVSIEGAARLNTIGGVSTQILHPTVDVDQQPLFIEMKN